MLDHIFPTGSYSFKLSHIAGTSYPLWREFRVFISQSPTEPNKCIKTLFGQSWYGDIVVAKYGKARNNTQEALQVLVYEVDMIHVALGA